MLRFSDSRKTAKAVAMVDAAMVDAKVDVTDEETLPAESAHPISKDQSKG
jgi:hypothetical protein